MNGFVALEVWRILVIFPLIFLMIILAVIGLCVEVAQGRTRDKIQNPQQNEADNDNKKSR